MANIQQVRYTQPSNRPSPWEAGLQGFMGGMAGYQGRQAKQQENIMNLLPVLAQMKMLKSGGKPGQPGVVGGAQGIPPFTITDPQQDYSQSLAQKRGQKLDYELDPESRPEAYTRSQIETKVRNSLLASESYRDRLRRKPDEARIIRENAIDIELERVGLKAFPGKGEDKDEGENRPAQIDPGSWATAPVSERLKAGFTFGATPGEVKRGPLKPWQTLTNAPTQLPTKILDTFKPGQKTDSKKRFNALKKKVPDITWEEWSGMDPQDKQTLEQAYK